MLSSWSMVKGVMQYLSLSLIFLATGFSMGFGHCTGMCGPIAAGISLNRKNQSIVTSHLLYHAGRITTYSFLGGILGIAGSLTMFTTSMVLFQKAVLIIAGAIVIIMGLSMLMDNVPFRFPEYNNYCNRFFSPNFKKFFTPDSHLKYFPLGLILGLLPCGSVYTALMATARAGMETSTPIQGFLAGFGLMAAFGIGTTPALLLIARLADLKWIKSKKIIYNTGSILMIVVGLMFIVRGAMR